jgi:DNA polymerase bacteriophage-type
LAGTILELRQILGKSSSAKFAKLALMEWHGRIYNNLQYYRAGTGRWGGRGFQPQNLPRLQLKDALKIKEKLSLSELLELQEEVINNFINMDPIDGALNISKSLIRGMIKASPGNSLIVRDYSSIENRLLHWYAGDEDTLDKFRSPDYDQYVDMAAFLFNKDEAAIGKKSHERQVGKVIILGCGFIMGKDRFLAECEKYGIEMDDSGAHMAVTAYRAKYPLVKKMWYRLYDAVKAAIIQPGMSFKCHKCVFKVVKDRKGTRWLSITLASGRAMYYMEPYLAEGKFGITVRHKGQHPKTHQWTDVPLSITRVVENIIQGTARDVMAEGILNIRRELPEVKLVCTVHDEGIGECDSVNAEYYADKFEELMCRMPSWADGLPLHAAGYVAQRYRKD